MARMSSPNGDEVLTVHDEVGANVLRSLGWSQEGGSSGGSSDSGATSGADSATSPESQAPAKRKPGRPRKNPPPEGDSSESSEE